MGSVLKKSNLTKNQIYQLRRLLLIKPKRKIFSYTDFHLPPKPLSFYLETETDFIVPYYFAKVFTKNNINNKIIYNNSFIFKGQLRDHQKEIINESLKQLEKYGTTLIAANPGTGKTVMAIYLSQKLSCLTLILYHRSTLEKQWLTTINRFTNVSTWVIGNSKPDKFDIILSMDKQFTKIPLDILQSIKCLIIDEAHAFCTPTHIITWLGTQPLYIITLTATPEREDGMHIMQQAVCGTHGVFKSSIKPFTIYKLLTNIQPPVVLNRHGKIDWNVLTDYLCDSQLRNRYILNIALCNPDKKIMILTWKVNHAFKLYQWLKNLNESVAVLAGKKKTYLDSRILVGTISKIGTGFDEETACDNFEGTRINLLILCGTTRSPTTIEQNLGRVMRSEYPSIIVLVDHNKVIKNHWSIIKNWALNHNGTESFLPPPHENDLLKQVKELSLS